MRFHTLGGIWCHTTLFSPPCHTHTHTQIVLTAPIKEKAASKVLSGPNLNSWPNALSFYVGPNAQTSSLECFFLIKGVDR